MKTVKGLYRASRPVNMLIAVFSVLVAAMMTDSIRSYNPVFYACLSAAFLTAAANAINDYYDFEIDKINKPERPIPSGLVSRQQIWWFALFCFVLGFLASCLINATTVTLALISVFLLYAYSAFFKRTVLWGNMLVSVMTGLAFVYGSAAVGKAIYGIIPACFAFLMHFGREIIKDMEDAKGDRAFHAYTLPVRYGFRISRILAISIFLVLLIATFVPYILDIYGRWYLILVVFLVHTVIIYTIIVLWKKPNTQKLGRLSVLLKADMLAGLLAIWMG